MWKFLLITSCIFWRAMDAGGVPQHIRKRDVGSYAGSYSDSNRGYNGNYNDYDDFGYAPDFGFGSFDPFALHQQILAQQAAHQRAFASTFNTGDAMVTAYASNFPNDFQDLTENFNRQHAEFFENIRRQIEENFQGSNNNRYAPNYSAAGASVGPDGDYQSAFISSENPAIPNISNRFSPDGSINFKGISVSSYSSSSDINGKKSSQRGAQAVINDNGRITTYKVQS